MTITFPSRYYYGFEVTATSTSEISHGKYVWELTIGDGEIYDKVFLEDVISEIIGY